MEDDETPSSTMPVAADMTATERLESEMSSYECIYGIPQSLLILLKESIEVIDEVNSRRTNAENSYIPDPLAASQV